MENEINKVKPYERLQGLLSENSKTLSDRGNDNINKILGITETETPTFWDKLKSFFNKIDGLIFKKSSKIGTRYQRRD